MEAEGGGRAKLREVVMSGLLANAILMGTHLLAAPGTVPLAGGSGRKARRVAGGGVDVGDEGSET